MVVVVTQLYNTCSGIPYKPSIKICTLKDSAASNAPRMELPPSHIGHIRKLTYNIEIHAVKLRHHRLENQPVH